MSDDLDFSGDVSLDDEPEQNANQWLKLTQGQCARIALLYFHPVNAVAKKRAGKAVPLPSKDALEAIGRQALEVRAKELGKPVEQLTDIECLDLNLVQFKKTLAHYQAGEVGYTLTRLGMDGPEADAVWRRLPEAKTFYSTVVAIYPTNSRGDIGEGEKARVHTDTYVSRWRISGQMFDHLFKLNTGLKELGAGLHNQDLKLECKGGKFNKTEAAFVGKAIWRMNPKFQAEVLGKALPMYKKLVPFRGFTTEELRVKLGFSGTSATTGDVSGPLASSEFNDFLSNV